MDSKKLEQLGLSKSESQIYLRLLELGSSKVGKLSKELPYNRTTIYKALDKLIQKGLVSSILRENTKYFEASSPKNLKENLEKEKLLLKQKETSINAIIPELNHLFNKTKPEQEATIYKGQKGIKTIFNDILSTLKEGDEYLAFGIPHEAEQFSGFMKEFAKTTQKNKIKSRIIFDERAKELIRSSKEHGYDVHTLRKEFYTPSEVNIYKNKVAIVLWTSNPIGFLIKDSEISKSFKTYFNLLWKMSK